MYAKAVWREGAATALQDDRGHEVTVDLPPSEGGKDAGTSALELNLLSLAGCISTIFGIVARKRRVPFTGLEVDLEAERPSGAPTILRVHGTFRVTSHAPREDVESALGVTLRTCPVGVLYEQAGIPMDIDLVLTAPSAPGPPLERLPLPAY